VALLDRFVRVRGGTLVLLPDRALSGPVTRLLRGRWTERRLRGAQRVGPLTASELLEGDDIGPLDIVLGRRGDRAIITAAPMAAGRVVVSGAMDAWRHRAEGDGAFDRFWVGLVADASHSRHSVDVDLARSVAAPGARVPVTVRRRSMDRIDAMRITAAFDCGTGAPEPLRLWPAGQPGTLGGTLVVPAQGPCTVTASADGGGVGRAGLSVAARPRMSVGGAWRDVERAVAARGGVLATIGDEERVAEWVRTLPKPAPTWVPAHPMRSPWWLLPLVACLGAEWWLRRREGLK